MSARSPSAPASLHRRGWHRSAAELLALMAGLALFSWLHDLAGTDVAAATTNAQALQALEHALRLDIEPIANHWLAHRMVMAQAATWYYRLYYLPLAGVLLWTLCARYEAYVAVRRTLTVMAPLALLVFWLVPMSPPRFAMADITDIVAEYDMVSGDASRDLANGQNHFSAMPSLHVGWSALCAYGAWLALRDRRSRLVLLVWLFPAVMVAVVISTGNHYVLDVAGSAVLLGISIAVATVWQRWRPARGVRSRLILRRDGVPPPLFGTGDVIVGGRSTHADGGPGDDPAPPHSG